MLVTKHLVTSACAFICLQVYNIIKSLYLIFSKKSFLLRAYPKSQ
jgi:hypothetical protein